MKTVNLNFNGFEFTITETDKGFNVNDLRLQVADFVEKNSELLIRSSKFNSTADMTRWVRYLSDNAKNFYDYLVVRGNGAGTYVNERGLYAYASWLNEGFGFAVIEAFTLMVNGEVEEAVKVVKKVVRTAIRQDNVDYTNYFASRINRQFGDELIASVMRTIQNHINRTLFGVETEKLREMAREHSGSKAKKIAHREFYDDATIIRITSMTTACIQKFEELFGQALSPKELLNEMQGFIDKYGELCGGAKEPSYKNK